MTTQTQDATITVKAGYLPSVVRVRAGEPVRLTFDRQEEMGCSRELVIPDFGIRTSLPAWERTTVEFTPEAPGTYKFACGMDMLRGQIVVE